MYNKRLNYQKKKYHKKLLSDNAIYVNWIRNLDVRPLFEDDIWTIIPTFDLTQLGMALTTAILPVEFEPYTIDFEYQSPTSDEVKQGIWVKFTKVRFDELYRWMTDFREYVLENFKEEFQSSILFLMPEKAVYGETRYGMGIYDPTVQREMIRATLWKLRQRTTVDEHWLVTMEGIITLLEMLGITKEVMWNRLMMMFTAQSESFLLGFNVLGKSKLTEKDGDKAKITIIDARGNIVDIKFNTLEHLQFGFILGLTPLGMGYLLPKESVYKLVDGKKNPPILNVLDKKIRGIRSRLPLTAFAYANYNKPEEMTSEHKSDRAHQYQYLMTLRRHIESIVERAIPPEESNPMKIRQYQNAVLQLISWKAKRHRWGYGGFEAMTEEQFKEFWLDYWSKQGLNTKILNNLYRGLEKWLVDIRLMKLNIGKKVQQVRKRLALAI